MKILSGVLTVAGLLWFASCASVGQMFVEKPNVHLDRVRAQNATATGATVVFGFEVENPNSFDLKLDRLIYKAEIGSHSISSGDLNQLPAVPAKSKAVIELPVTVKYSDLVASLIDLLQTRSSTYHLTGEAKFGLLTIPFDEKGEFKLER